MKILHDVHTHNLFSHCCWDYSASTEAFIQKEQEIGNRVFGLSNHIWDERVKGASYWYSRQTIALAEEAKAAIRRERDGIRCLFGVEGEFFGHQNILGMSYEGAQHFDYLLIPHSHLHMRNRVMSDFPEVLEMRAAIEAKVREACPFLADDAVKAMVNSLGEAHLMKYIPEMKTNVGEFIAKKSIENFHLLMDHPEFIKICATVPTSISHPFNLCGVANELKNEYLRLIDDETLLDCFQRAKRIGAYVEVNIGSVGECGWDLSQNELMRVFAAAKKAGCQFTFGTDSHSVNSLACIRRGDQICDYLGLTRSDIAPFLAEDGVED